MVHVTPITLNFAAEIGGVDARCQLDESAVAEIIRALDRYAVVIFRDQYLTQEQQVRFARQFGNTQDPTLKKMLASFQNPLQYDELSNISNVDKSGQIAGRTDQLTMVHLNNMMWHSDGSYDHYPKRYSMLLGVTIPSWGANTEYADLRAAYDALDDRTKTMIADMMAEHYGLTMRSPVVPPDVKVPATRWPLVRIHPATGRKVLFVGTYIREIIGMPNPEGMLFSAELLEHATQREFVYSHKWREGDLVIWDNRSALHRVRRFDFTERRELRRASTMDDVGAPAA